MGALSPLSSVQHRADHGSIQKRWAATRIWGGIRRAAQVCQSGQNNLKPTARKSFLDLAIHRVTAKLPSRCWSNGSKGPKLTNSFRMLERETGFEPATSSLGTSRMDVSTTT